MNEAAVAVVNRSMSEAPRPETVERDVCPFACLGLEVTFALDPQVLEQAYFTKQRHVHPDRLRISSLEARTEAERLSAEVNAAYQQLKDPLQRGLHVLMAHGESLPTAFTQDPELLMETLEWRQQLAEDPAQRATLQAQWAAELTHLAQAFAAQKWTDAARLLARLQYLHKTLKGHA